MKKYESYAHWPKGVGIELGNDLNESTDQHDTAPQAEAMARRLRVEGFGGEGKIFPNATGTRFTPVRNVIGGIVKLVTRPEMYAKADKGIRPILDQRLARKDVAGLICYENLQMDSSMFGHRAFLIFGDGCENKTVFDAAAKRLGDVPSRFQYPVFYYEK